MKSILSFCLAILLGAGSLTALPATNFNFNRFQLPKTPHYYLSCPPNYCRSLTHQTTPIYPIPKKNLIILWKRMIATEPRVMLIAVDLTQDQYHYVQRSKNLNLPDDIYIKFVNINQKRSSLLIFSVSRYGYWDFLGINQQRVDNWLKRLQILILNEVNKNKFQTR